MTEPRPISDQAARLRALAPDTSFIVQAPAGSGKTGLLTQRFLVLLAGVDAPEEILAITFTRKAAGEMRQRILQALDTAAGGPPAGVESDYNRQTRELAERALARDREQDWQLQANPARLRIQTIDALCTALVRQMPVLSRFGAIPAIAEDPEPLYVEAAGNTIAGLESGADWSAAIAHLVRYLDNRLDTLQELIATMLARRDLWLRHIADPAHPALERASLEVALAHLVEDSLAGLGQKVPADLREELLNLARYATANLQDSDSPIRACAELQELPGDQLQDRDAWEGLADLLLTQKDGWRRSVTKNQGFPAPGDATDPAGKARCKEMKQRMSNLLAALEDTEDLRRQLALLRTLPPHRYTESEWETLQALIDLLRIAAAHLELVFSARGLVDFQALAQAANQALGEPEFPTDLALALDYRIRHLLVDEFQDTSFNQFALLQRLTAGWQPGDGHTLFLVGDPMQSIYRFREAEVGLFLLARAQGLGQVPLEFLRLEVNFRSQAGIVDWLNQAFPEILPATDDPAGGAIAYTPAMAIQPPLEGTAVTFHPFLERDDRAEARQVIELVQQAAYEHPEGTTAILVRSRSHLARIIDCLQQAGLRFQAVDIERLAHRPVIQDLLALTRALIHPADRIAWLALLRAPYCGLTLGDLFTLADNNHTSTVFASLQEPQRLERLSDDGRRRLARIVPILATALAERDRGGLRDYVEGVWLTLGGPACVTEPTDLEDAEVYLQLLETFGTTGDIPDSHALTEQVEQLYALPDVTADGSLQLMTLHKAKGLEFDTVILPGLGRQPGQAEERLLYWLERSHGTGGSDLLLAPVSALGEDRNRIMACLQQLDKARDRYEDGRLLYVAATRARRRLHLLGHTSLGEQEGVLTVKVPPATTLLARLWPVVQEAYRHHLEGGYARPQPAEAPVSDQVQDRSYQRLATGWQPPGPPPAVAVAVSTPGPAAGEQVEFDWATETARHIGTVVHRLLQQLARNGNREPDTDNLSRYREVARHMLMHLGVPENRLADAAAEVTRALQEVQNDDRGQWIIDPRHQEAACELALSGRRNGQVDHLIIDRTFIDDNGIRWIIDYKTGSHSGSGIEEFLDREVERYRWQLERYAAVMRRMDKRPIRLALYFPLLHGWREWPYEVE